MPTMDNITLSTFPEKCIFLSVLRLVEACVALMTSRCCFLWQLLLRSPSPSVLSLTPGPIGEHTAPLLPDMAAGRGLSLPRLSLANVVQQEGPPALLVQRLVVPTAAQGALIRTLTWLGILCSSWIISVEGQMVFVSAWWGGHLSLFFLEKENKNPALVPRGSPLLATRRVFVLPGSCGTQFIQIVEMNGERCRLHE